jgi:hypothetical protein
MDANPEHKAAPKAITGRINGRFAPGYSGNPGGSPEATRRAFNKRFLLDLAEEVLKNRCCSKTTKKLTSGFLVSFPEFVSADWARLKAIHGARPG